MEGMDESKMALELTKLNAKRQIFFSELQDTYDLSQKLDQEEARMEFLARVSDLEENVRRVEELSDQIVDLNLRLTPKAPPNYQVVKVVATLRQKIKMAHKSLNVASSPPQTEVQYKLPKINLPEFSGEISEWPLFYEKFITIVHDNSSLSPLSKLHYLLGCLKGKALELCSGITPSSSNYEVILNVLKSKYNNKRYLADIHFNQMLDLKPLTQESAVGLSELVLKFDAAYKSLKELQLNDLTDYFAASLILKKLDVQTRRDFETSKHEKIPTYEEVLTFLSTQIDALMQLPKVRPNFTPRTFASRSGASPKVSNFLTKIQDSSAEADTNRPVFTCPYCTSSHPLFKCYEFIALKSADRVSFVKDKNLCFNCLSSQHTLPACKSQQKCRFCQAQHHSLIHPVAPPENSSPFCALNQPHLLSEKTTVLPTAVVLVETPTGLQKARFLIDTASQSHFVTEDCLHRIGLSFEGQQTSISGIGNVTTATLGKSTFTVASRFNPKTHWEIQALVVQRITEYLPFIPLSRVDLQYLMHLPLADEEFFIPNRVDGILGAEIFGLILGPSKIVGPPNTPIAVETMLGYVVLGHAPTSKGVSAMVASRDRLVYCSFDETNLTAAVKKFWELEEVPTISTASEEDQRCEHLFATTTSRDPSGRYCVHLPFQEWPPTLGESWGVAARRFWSLEHRFRRNPKLFEQYANVIQDYLDQGHLTEISNSHLEARDLSVFIPHFPVLKESSSTPLRIVFDASVKTSNGTSLNDVLLTGPKLHKNLFQLLLEFRISRIALTSDIKQMYRNITVTPTHRRFQRILWRDSPSQQLKVYELNSVVFGITSAPYLALRTVQQLSRDEQHRFPLASALVNNSMYVDDLVISLDSPKEAIAAFHELTEMFKAGGFKLTKWSSNSSEVTSVIPNEDLLLSPVRFDDTSTLNSSTMVKILGLNWTATSDGFSFDVTFPDPVWTKRGILSTIARIWDPLGFLAPVTLFAKHLVKELWKQKSGWDDEIPASIRQRWQVFHSELGELQNLQIPRHFGHTPDTQIILVGFCDSSEKGLGAVIYTVVQQTERVSLLCAKSKVTPLKTCTLPRLELCAALLLAKLMHVCLSSLQPRTNVHAIYACTDSSVALHWISHEPHRWKTFVANRVAKIQALTPNTNWVHIRSEQNIADCISRGQTPSQLMQNPQWTQGPPWLRLPPLEWPVTSLSTIQPSEDTSELKTFVATVHGGREVEELEEFFQRFSSWRKLLHVTVYLLRFAGRLPRQSRITLKDLEKAEHTLIRRAQHVYYIEEFKLLEKTQLCSTKLRPLAPFLHNDILRVGGRISRSDLGFGSKHPILIPQTSHLAKLIIDHTHRINLHTGPSLVMSLIRQKYWIPGSRNLVRRRIHSCNVCFKANPRPVCPPMADLPTARVLQAKPFLHTGVDYAGPFLITISRRRGSRAQKAYLCLFICFSTKAVHLELASDLSTESFLNCFKRFISRRGPVKCLYSDRGTNFIGAKAELDNMYRFLESDEFVQSSQNYFQERKIDWVFNPPQAPHFGGIWESNIKAVKNHLRKVLGKQILSYEELNTVLTQIEALVNSRPLSVLSSDPSEAEALTPAHFLTLMPLQDLPLTPFQATHNFRQRKELLDSIIQSFWKRWRLEYLSSLQPRRKWTSSVPPLTVGTVVIVREENSPPLHWPLGVVAEVFPGADGVIRAATVRVGRTVYQRPTVKLYPLPTQ